MFGVTDPAEGEYYRRRCADLEAENSRLKTRVAELEAKLASLETTELAMVARRGRVQRLQPGPHTLAIGVQEAL